MAGQDPLAKTIADLKQRLSHLEALLENAPKKKKSAQPTTLVEHITKLRDSRFFAQPRTVEEVHKKPLPSYVCEPNRVAVALHRLAAKKQLRKAKKTNSGRGYQAYVW